MSKRPISVRRFLADTSGEVPMDFIALTASMMLLGAMYIGTNPDKSDEPQVGYSEEVFVRKCANVRVDGQGSGLAGLKNSTVCQ